MKKWKFFWVMLTACLLLGGCAKEKNSGTGEDSLSLEENAQADASQEQTEETTESLTEDPAQDTQSPEKSNEADLASLKDLPGMTDEETADMFGGGEENWTEDKQFYIGRIFLISLYGEEYQMYTTCSEEGIVESVSVWIVSGERAVTDEETETWVGRITELMGTEPVYDGESSEAGSRNWKWLADGSSAAVYRMEDTLTLSFQPAVGELK